jgi:hypothetical protein
VLAGRGARAAAHGRVDPGVRRHRHLVGRRPGRPQLRRVGVVGPVRSGQHRPAPSCSGSATGAGPGSSSMRCSACSSR